MLDLPQPFLRQMYELLDQEEYETFLHTYEEPATRGLRTNTLKITPQRLAGWLPFDLKPIPWCPSGYYYRPDERPGIHPYHHAGLYYIQEPSAMAVVEQLDPQPGDWVLDLCAAPGGKSTQIAAKLQGNGWLISNDIHGGRVKALAENLERCGVRNATVLNSTPQQIRTRFSAVFHRILVDAPCSGEGMFRKNPEAVLEWHLEAVTDCALRQQQILKQAVPMLRPGGRLVYSTCTFNDSENEAIIAWLLHTFPELRLIHQKRTDLFSPGVARSRDTVSVGQQVVRLWPHRLKGEGHFIALLEKQTHPSHLPSDVEEKSSGMEHTLSPVQTRSLQAFEQASLIRPLARKRLVVFGTHLYETHRALPDLSGIKVTRPGFYLGEFKKNRFEPSHALAMALTNREAQQTTPLTMKQPAIVAAYLRGETVQSDREHTGWTLVTVDGFPLGWGKQVGSVVKNHLPKQLRRNV